MGGVRPSDLDILPGYSHPDTQQLAFLFLVCFALLFLKVVCWTGLPRTPRLNRILPAQKREAKRQWSCQAG